MPAVDLLTRIQISNLVTMSICADKDKRQEIGEPYTVPNQEIRLLRAKLIIEEALETVKALGFDLSAGHFYLNALTKFTFEANNEPNLEGIIDGCVDLNYVTSGTLASCGVPEGPHIDEVCRANEDKFPKGIPIFNEIGKYQKPQGWKGPDHNKVQLAVMSIGGSLESYVEKVVTPHIEKLRAK